MTQVTVSPQRAHDLSEAVELPSGLCIRQHASQIDAGFTADIHLRPSSWSNFERAQFKGTSGVVKTPPDGPTPRSRNA